jgi:hypothetical protein
MNLQQLLAWIKARSFEQTTWIAVAFILSMFGTQFPASFVELWQSGVLSIETAGMAIIDAAMYLTAIWKIVTPQKKG